MKQLEKADIEKLTLYTDNTEITIDTEIKLFPLLMRETIANELIIST
jgi:hypothetical protein